VIGIRASKVTAALLLTPGSVDPPASQLIPTVLFTSLMTSASVLFIRPHFRHTPTPAAPSTPPPPIPPPHPPPSPPFTAPPPSPPGPLLTVYAPNPTQPTIFSNLAGDNHSNFYAYMGLGDSPDTNYYVSAYNFTAPSTSDFVFTGGSILASYSSGANIINAS